MLAFEYTGRGFVPVIVPVQVKEDLSAVTYLGQRIVDAHPVVTRWTVARRARSTLTRSSRSRGAYGGVGDMKLQSVYPIVAGYKDYTAAGFKMTLSDPLQLECIEATLAYAPSPR